jgi:branched-chain amino acid transport system permease protein
MLPTGIFFETYGAEARILKTRRSRIWLAALALALLAAPLVTGAYVLGEMTNLFISLVAVYGLFVTVGMAGQINIAQSAFVGIGAFSAAKLSGLGVPFWLVIPASALITASISTLFALPAARVKGFYLALTTLAAQVMFPIVILALPMDWLGGLVGMAVEPIYLFGISLSHPVGFYYLALLLAALATIGAFNLPRSRFGRAMMAVRDNDTAASVMGIPVLQVKVMAFFAGSLFAGMAGAMAAYFLQFVTVESFTLFASVWYLGMLIVGGLRSPVGVALGVTFIALLQEGLHAVASAMMQSGAVGGGAAFALSSVVLGACILLALIFEPRGLAHRWSVIRTGFQIWPFPRN